MVNIMSKLHVALKYSLFAVVSTVVNLGVQWIIGHIYTGSYNLYISIFFGTGTGLITKYYLDKKYIFHYSTKKKIKDLQKFIIYTLTGIITTAIFWGFEIGFYYIFPQENSKYIGATIGLSAGYIGKYFLDRIFVFRQKEFKESELLEE